MTMSSWATSTLSGSTLTGDKGDFRLSNLQFLTTAQNTRKYNSCNSFFYLCTNNKSVYLLLSIEQYSHYRSLLLLLLLLVVLLMLLADEESLPCAGSDWVEHLCPQP